MIKFLFLIFMIPSFIYSMEVVKTEESNDNWKEMSVVKFDGHSYIFFRNYACSNCEQFIHDPSCECFLPKKKTINKLDKKSYIYKDFLHETVRQ